MYKFFALLLLLLPLSCLAQFTITGKVLNQDDKKPVVSASVFLNNATIGNASAENGSFVLNGVSSGKYTLVVSIVGYETYTETVVVDNADIKLDNIYLTPKNHVLKEVFVKPDPNRELNILMFKEQFLGKDDLAAECKILNPEVLNISYDETTRILSATSDGFLDIENDALGYKIKYLLADFQYLKDLDTPKIQYRGSVFFEPLKGSAGQLRRWQKRRQEIYENSAMHFFRSAVRGNILREGFKVQQYAHYANPDRPTDSVIQAKIAYYKKMISTASEADNFRIYNQNLSIWKKKTTLPLTIWKLYPYALTQQEIISRTDVPSIYAIGCNYDGLLVTYDKNGHFYDNIKINHVNNPKNTEATLMTFNDPYGFIDRNGSSADPYSMFFTGVWAAQRVGDLLPVDYAVPQTVNDVHVDSTVLKNVMAKMQIYSPKHAIEKTYLQFDKPYYTAGDTIYFKAYLTAGGKHELSALSGILHADLIANDTIARSVNLEVNNGVAWGDFALSDSIPIGNYRVRAYTQWMRNESEPHFFDRMIPVESVISNKVKKGSKTMSAASKPDVQFFAEGGSFVTGVRSKMAFKAIGLNGLGVAVKGVVIDGDNKQVCTFSSMHLGMGYFYITPQEGKTYKAKITYTNGTTDTFDLPAADNNGIALSVTGNDSTQRAAITIMAGKNYYQQNRNKDYTIVVYSAGSLSSFICKLDNPTVMVDVFEKTMHSGITRFTLFSPIGEPLCERRVFIQNYDGLKLNLSSDKKVYPTRDKVAIKLNAVDNDGAPVAGNFSVSVTDEGKVPVDENSENTIVNNLLLTSDLKGYVEQPNYYFLPENTDAAGNLDVLMLTQGYRGFEWKRVLNADSTAVAYQPENSLQLSGTVKTITGKPVPDGKISLLSTRQNVVMDTTIDANGNFKFTGLYLTDTTTLVLHANKKNNSDLVKIQVNKPDYPSITKINTPDTSLAALTPEMAAAIKKQNAIRHGFMKSGIMLKQVNVKSQGSNALHPPLTHSANMNGAGNADAIIMGDKLFTCIHLTDCLQGLIPGVIVEGNIFYTQHTHLEFIGPRQPMVVIIDGAMNEQQQHGGPNILDELNPLDIYSIEILENHALLTIYGSEAAGGAIVITTKRGDEGHADAHPNGYALYTFNGFQKAHTFYSPKYEAAAPANNIPDTRSTIYWNPELLTDKNGDAAFDFYNADGTGTYRVVIEGIDAYGNIGRRVYHYKVQ